MSRNGARPSPFALPDRLAAKAAPPLIRDDEDFFALLSRTLGHTVADLTRRRDEARRAPGRSGQEALERDLEIHRLTARLRTLQRYDLDLCLGHMVYAGTPAGVYIGRLGLADDSGQPVLLDWRSPAAAPFFAATHADPAGLTRRRRYRWTDGRITDYWDEVFDAVGIGDGTGDGTDPHAELRRAALDDQSAFVASLGAVRTTRMRDVLGTIAADQDAAVRADSAGTLVVDGGPGTGKTVVALHRAAYLLHADPRLRRADPRAAGHGGLLVIGPHQPYLAYVDDVLPGLGEDSVQTCTLRDLVDEGAQAGVEAHPVVAALKARLDLVAAIEPAVALYEQPPTRPLLVDTPWSQLRVGVDDWAEAFAAPEPGTPHNAARDQVWDALVARLVEQHRDEYDEYDGDDGDGSVTDAQLDRALRGHHELQTTLTRAWPLLTAADLVADLWTVPTYLRRCAPALTPAEVASLQRTDGYAWTESDLPLLDAAHRRLGDPDAVVRRARRRIAAAHEQEQRDAVTEDLIRADDSELMVMSMLRGDDARTTLAAADDRDPDAGGRLAGPYAHIVVDEAQELTDAQWQMVLARCPSRSLTVVGDRAQARAGFAEPWPERLQRVGLNRIALTTLRTNYRTPVEIMAEAEPVIRAALPDANVPVSIRTSGVPVRHGSVDELGDVVEAWTRQHPDGVACVIGAPDFPDGSRVRSLTPAHSKGLEFDLVVLVDPAALGPGTPGAVDRYVAMTRATRELVVLGAG